MYDEPAYRWADPIWREAAEAWIHEIVAQGGNAVTGPIDSVRFLPWSAVLRAQVWPALPGPGQVPRPWSETPQATPSRQMRPHSPRPEVALQ